MPDGVSILDHPLLTSLSHSLDYTFHNWVLSVIHRNLLLFRWVGERHPMSRFVSYRCLTTATAIVSPCPLIGKVLSKRPLPDTGGHKVREGGPPLEKGSFVLWNIYNNSSPVLRSSFDWLPIHVSLPRIYKRGVGRNCTGLLREARNPCCTLC